jgi:hypothetical protein
MLRKTALEESKMSVLDFNVPFIIRRQVITGEYTMYYLTERTSLAYSLVIPLSDSRFLLLSDDMKMSKYIDSLEKYGMIGDKIELAKQAA